MHWWSPSMSSETIDKQMLGRKNCGSKISSFWNVRNSLTCSRYLDISLIHGKASSSFSSHYFKFVKKIKNGILKKWETLLLICHILLTAICALSILPCLYFSNTDPNNTMIMTIFIHSLPLDVPLIMTPSSPLHIDLYLPWNLSQNYWVFLST